MTNFGQDVNDDSYDWRGAAKAGGAGASKSALMQAIDSTATPPPDEQLAALDSLSQPPDPTPQPQGMDAADVPAPSFDKPPTPPPAMQAQPRQAPQGNSARAERLAALQSLSGDSDETAIRDAAKRDRQRADSAQLSEYIAAAVARRPSQQTAAGPSDIDTEKLLQSSRDKRAELAFRNKEKPPDQSLVDFRNAQTKHLGALATQAADEEKRRAAGDHASEEDKRLTRDFNERKLAADIDSKTTDAERRAEHEAGAEKWRRMDYAQRERAIAAAGARAEKKTDEGSKLSQTSVNDLADIDAAVQMVDELAKSHRELGMGGADARVSSAVSGPLNLNTKAAQYGDKARVTAQAAGKILEGGKLSAGDEPKYKNMMPQPGDSDLRRDEKAKNLKHMLELVRDSRLKELKGAGYRTPTNAPAPPVGDKVDLIAPDGHRAKADAAGLDEWLAKHPGWSKAGG